MPMRTSELAALLNLLEGTSPKTRRLTASEKADIKDGAEFRKLLKELQEGYRKELPDLSQDSLMRLVEFTFGLMVALGPDAEGDTALLGKISSTALTELAKAEKQWAVDVGHAMLNNKFKPAYDKAVRAGVDPAVIFQADFQMDADKARETVEQIKKAETEGKLTK